VGIRFRKSIKLAPGVRWNFSGSGSSWTIGPRGASVGIGKRGVFLNSGIPGTGLSLRSQVSAPAAQASEPLPPGMKAFALTCAVADDGTLSFTDSAGAPVSERFVNLAKRQGRQAIMDLIQAKCEEINEQIESLGRLHHDTPNPHTPPSFVPTPFPVARPEPPLDRTPRFWEHLIPGRRKQIELDNNQRSTWHQSDLSRWEADREAFYRCAEERKTLVETLIYKDTAAMERFLEQSLSEIVWPRETTVTFEIADSGSAVALDVDLPEVEDMPSKLAAVPARGLKLSVKTLSQTKIHTLYAEHIHGIVFRLIGEVFAALPNTAQVTAAGYSQRRDPATAQLRDDYLLSVKVARTVWNGLDFDHIASIDVVAALEQFDLRREMLKSGLLRPISPHE
jgi:hypothetical protein